MGRTRIQMTMTLGPETQLGRYRIIEPIGKGGMGEVYRAKDTRLERDVAVKVLPEATSKDEVALSRFAREAKAVAALSHPNILAIYDVGESEGVSYVVTELLEGETLRDRMTQSRMSWRQALEFGASIADGLAAAHDRGVIHRDLKPENVFLTNDGVVKILDFGLARIESPAPSGDAANTPTMTIATAPGSVMGTIHYMSPEQVRGLKTDARSDIFSFGCVLYEMVAGERAFQGKTAADTMTAILREEPENVTASVRGMSPELDRLVVRCLDKRPERRFHSASDLAFALRSMLSDSGSTPPAARAQRQATRIGGVLGNVFVAGLILIVGVLGWREWFQSPPPVGGPIRRIAVLALENRSGDPEQEVYADAMTEAITDALAQVSALHVISPRTMLRMKGTDLSISEIAEKLGVDAIVHATRVQVGDRIQVRARLVDGATERQIWSDHYERDVRNVFAMQNEIALAIAGGVKVKLTPTEQAMLADAPTIEPPAYDFYVEGLDLTRKKTRTSCLAALSLFDRALEIDPEFALAHAGRAKAYYELASTHLRPSETMPQMKQAAMAALALDPNLPEAHVALGNFELEYKWNWLGAEDFYKRALDVNASHSGASLSYALYLTSMKRFDEAREHLDRVQEIDPDAKQYETDYGGIAFMSRDYQRVVRDSQEVLKVDPNNWPALQWLGLAREQLGQVTEAIGDLRKAWRISQSATVHAMLGGALANAGEIREARAIRRKLKAERVQNYVCPYEVATISIGLKEFDQAFDEIDEACDDRARCIPWLQVDPRLDPIRHLPRFDALLRRVGFKPPELVATAIPQEIRLAVLPFKDQSANPKQWFADSMTGELIAALAKVKALHVRSRTSSMRYKNSNKPLPEIARELNANMVIDATVINVDGRIRITVELIDATTDTPVWSGNYTRANQDVLALQDEIARSIAQGIQLELSPRENRRLSGATPVNPAAYNAYLQGRFHLRQASVKDAKKAQARFEEATRLDSDFALAYAGLADALIAQETHYLAPRVVMPKARAAALQALELDNTLAEAHASLAIVMRDFDWDWEAAERGFLRALDLNPGLSAAHLGYARYLAIMGRFDEAIQHLNQAKEYDPYSVATSKDYGLVYMLARDFDAMATVSRRGIALAPKLWVGHSMLGMSLAQNGHFDEAIAETIMARDLNPNPAMLADLGVVYAMAGRESDARDVLLELDRLREEAYVCPYRSGGIYIHLGEFDTAFEWLGQACDDKSECMPLINYDPRLDPIRNDSRFDALIDCVGLERNPLPLTLAEAPTTRTSLAVLPFENLNKNPDTEYLSIEIPASIIDKLSGLSDLRVTSRSGAFRFDPATQDASSFGRRLGVSVVLTGQLNTRGNNLTLRAELVDVSTNQQLWSKRYPRELSDIMAIEADMAQSISEALRLELSQEERSSLAKEHTKNTEAYRSVLQGRYWFEKFTRAGWRRALGHFQDAVRIDPKYAVGHAELSKSYSALGIWFGDMPLNEAGPKAKQAAQTAIALDDSLGEAHSALGFIRLFYDWNWSGAEEEFLESIRLAPESGQVHIHYTILLRLMGRFREAVEVMKVAQLLDPNFPMNFANLGIIYANMGRFEEGIEQCKKGLDLDPQFPPAFATLGHIFFAKGMYAEAIAHYEKYSSLRNRQTGDLGTLGAAYAVAGQRAKALSVLDELRGVSSPGRGHAAAAMVYACLGDADAAFASLEQAYRYRDPGFIWINTELQFDPLRSDPRFDEMVRRIGLDPAARKPVLDEINP